jgi:virginiamycin B lyase
MDRKMLLLVAPILFWAATVVPASAQHFKQIPGSLAQVAAGRNEVWGLDAANQAYRFNSVTKTFTKIGTLKLTRIAVGGGSLLQTDQVWGVNAAGNIYKFNFNTNTFVHVAGTLAQIVVGEGYQDKCHPYEVWGLNAAELIFRYNSCTSQFEQVAGSLTVIATGAGAVWGLNSSAQIYDFDFGAHQFRQVPGSLQQIGVGVDQVWGFDGNGTLYQYSNGSFVARFSSSASNPQIAAGGSGVWIASGANMRRADPFKQFGLDFLFDSNLPSDIKQIAVGYGAGVWAINSSNHIYSFVRP